MSLICKFCGKESLSERSRASHENRCPLNENKKPNGMLGKKGNNQYLKAKAQGLPKPEMSDEAKAKISAAQKNRVCTDELRKIMSDHAHRRGLGGHLSKKRLYFEKKSGEVVNLHSSFETRFAQILEDLNLDWERPKPLIWFDDNGKSHRYYPDFKVGTVYIDTKNPYLMKIDAEKIQKVKENNEVDLRVIGEDLITEEFVLSLL